MVIERNLIPVDIISKTTSYPTPAGCITFAADHAIGIEVPAPHRSGHTIYGGSFVTLDVPRIYQEVSFATRVQLIETDATVLGLGVASWRVVDGYPRIHVSEAFSIPLDWDTWYYVDLRAGRDQRYSRYVTCTIYSDEARTLLIDTFDDEGLSFIGPSVPTLCPPTTLRNTALQNDGGGYGSWEIKDIQRVEWTYHARPEINQPRDILRPWYHLQSSMTYTATNVPATIVKTVEAGAPRNITTAPAWSFPILAVASWNLPDGSQYILFERGRIDVTEDLSLFRRTEIENPPREWVSPITIANHRRSPCVITLHPGYDVLVGCIAPNEGNEIRIIRLQADADPSGGIQYTVRPEVNTGFTALETGGFFLLENGQIGLLYRDTDYALQIIYSDLAGQTWTASEG